MKIHSIKSWLTLGWSALLFILCPISSHGADHDRFRTLPVDIYRESEAFVVSFDSQDDDNHDDQADMRGIPEWVAYEIQRYPAPCIPTKKRPRWFSDPELVAGGLAPQDASYAYSREWRSSHPDWYVRGHLCMKFIAERTSNAAAYNTHTLLNAVPQRDLFNRGIWEDLEELTAAWSQHYGKIWIITGPVFLDGQPHEWVGETEKGEMLVAVPDALFKIVIKEGGSPGTVDVLAFLYPQHDGSYSEKSYVHENFLVSVDRLEEITGLDFLTNLDDDLGSLIEGHPAERLWPIIEGNFIHACR